MKKKFDYKENGVTFSKATICVGDEVTLSYKGILAEKNSQNIYLHFGYGETWEEKQLVPMQQERGAYKLKLKVKYPGNLHFCFKDENEEWDNNGFNNYSISIAEENAKKEVAKKEVTKSATKKAEAKKAEPKKETEKKVKDAPKRASKTPKTDVKQ